MTFRDDHDAALARADALEAELKRTKAERDELAKELEKRSPTVEKPPAVETPEPETWLSASHALNNMSGRQIAGYVLLGVVVIGTVAVAGALKGQSQKARRDAWKAKVAARHDHIAHWYQLISVEPCVRDVALDTVGPVSRRRQYPGRDLVADRARARAVGHRRDRARGGRCLRRP